ncbi:MULTISPECIES: zinc-dependent alcohol dehydrogenase family protein [Citricoccus]|uniref:zinc-dependent alcohol dehydrogenase family protein n=1 Tax=Citricoccus TaxID=169133 RepID=UPI000255ED89|nr:zinc-dependent alcohol dehydrogenase family protein [Citricoccus sp. CH26A]
MKAMVYGGPGQKSWTEVPDPSVQQPTDAIVEIETTTICGTDLHILKGDVPAVRPGRVLGHEGVGRVVETGPAVTGVGVGDRVLVSCISSCGRCAYCIAGLNSHCLGPEGQSGIGWVLGHLIDGTQAEYVRIPYADTSLHRLPDSVSNTQGTMLSDILPTGFEIGVRYGQVQPGDTVAVVGAGPIGLAVILTSSLHGAARVFALDLEETRLELARSFGATETVLTSSPDWRAVVDDLTEGRGADVAVEAVGVPETFQMALDLVRPGGHVANVGVHGAPVEFHLEDLWIQNLTITTGLVNTNTTPMLLRLVASGRLPAEQFATHRFTFDDVMDAYDTFARPAETKALKVVITR